MDFAGKESNKSQIAIIVVSIISFVALIVMISFCIYLRVRKPREEPESKLNNWFIVICYLLSKLNYRKENDKSKSEIMCFSYIEMLPKVPW